MKLYFVTGSEGKLREARTLLDFNIEQLVNDIDEIQGTSEEIVVHKAKSAFSKFKKPLFVEDTSLEFNALKGLPGPYVKQFAETIGQEKLAKLLDGFDDKTAKAVVLIGYCDEGGVKVFRGELEGEIVMPRGQSGFGWDVIFVPKGYSKTFGEMTSEEKNKISHRKRAFERFKEFLG